MIQINKKGELTLSSFIISLIVFGLLIFGVVSWNNALSQKYGQPVTGDYETYYANVNATSIKIEQARSQIQGNSTSFYEELGFFTKGAIAVASTMFSSYDMFAKLLADGNEVLGINPIYILGFTAIVLIVLILLFVSAIFRYKL